MGYRLFFKKFILWAQCLLPKICLIGFYIFQSTFLFSPSLNALKLHQPFNFVIYPLTVLSTDLKCIIQCFLECSWIHRTIATVLPLARCGDIHWALLHKRLRQEYCEFKAQPGLCSDGKRGSEREGKERKQTLHPLAVAFQSLQEPLIYYGSMAVDLSVVEISYRNDFIFFL